MSAVAAAEHTNKTTKIFRPYRAAVRTVMKSCGDEDKFMIRGNTLNILEDVVIQTNTKLAQRMGTIVKAGGRSKISAKDAEAAVALEFGSEFAAQVMELANAAFEATKSEKKEEEDAE